MNSNQSCATAPPPTTTANNHANAIVFKIYKRHEIRRIMLPQLPSFDVIKTHLKTIFGDGFKEDVNSIMYIDEEGDHITVTSEIEWRAARAYFATVPNPKKLYIKRSLPWGFAGGDTCVPAIPLSPSTVPVSDPASTPALALKPAPALTPALELKPLPASTPALTLKPAPAPAPSSTPFQVQLSRCGPWSRRGEGMFGGVPGNLPMGQHNRALSFLKEGKYMEAKEILEKLVKQRPNSPLFLYNLACAEALLSNKSRAISLLKDAVASGYRNVYHMERDSDFDSIRDEKEFQDILSSLRERASKPCHGFRRFGYPGMKRNFACQEPASDASNKNKEESALDASNNDDSNNSPASLASPATINNTSSTSPIIKEDEEVKEEKKAEKFGEQLRVMRDMGFVDETANAALLARFDGDLTSAIDAALLFSHTHM